MICKYEEMKKMISMENRMGKFTILSDPFSPFATFFHEFW